MNKFELNVAAFGRLSDEEFFRFCQDNEDLRIERDATGRIIIMTPAGSLSENLNSRLFKEVDQWNRQARTGYVFDLSAVFVLPNGAVRSPAVSLVLTEKWEAPGRGVPGGLAPFCPDFVLEVKSGNDRLDDLQVKMEEYILNGAAFGWLIDPEEHKVYVYDVQSLPMPLSLIHSDFSNPLTGRYFMQDFSLILDDLR